MAKKNNVFPNVNIPDLFELLCYNLAQYSYLIKNYQPIQNITDYNTFVDVVANQFQSFSKNIRTQIGELRKALNKTTNPHLQKFYESQMNVLSQGIPYNIYRVADNKSAAKTAVKKTVLLDNFEIVVASQKKEARSYDSAGKINLFGSHIKVPFEQTLYLKHYWLLQSVGPIWHTHKLGRQAGQSQVDVLLSQQKPPKPVHHQIWINDNLMFRSKFLTNESLSEYVYKNQVLIDNIFYMIAFAQEIYQKNGQNCSQKILDEESKKRQLECAKYTYEKFLEQYGLLSIELFCSIVQQLKQKSGLPINTNVFDNVNKINGLTQLFSADEINRMKTYLAIRDQLAHPVEYNFRFLGDKTNNPNTVNYLTDFVSDMVTCLAKLLNKSEADIKNKIATIHEDRVYDVRPLILLMDARKALREICITKGNLNPNQPDVFLKLGMITADENKKLAVAAQLRNTLCHVKIDKELAKQAQEISWEVRPIIEKISKIIEQKYGECLHDYYFGYAGNSQKSSGIDLKKTYPFLNISLENDPDKDIFETAFQAKQAQSKEPLNRQLLQDLYMFTQTFQSMFLSNESLQNNTYYHEQDLNPFLMNIDKALQQPSDNPRRTIMQGLVSTWIAGTPIPPCKQLKTKSNGE